MKLGCGVHSIQNHAPYDEAIKRIGNLGFQGIELIAFTKGELDDYYTVEKCCELKKNYEFYGMELSEFILYAPLVEGLQAEDHSARAAAYDIFKRGLEVAHMLGTDIINIVANWPTELIAPIDYLPQFIHPYARGVSEFDPKLRMELPPSFDASGLWDRYMESLARLVGFTEKANMRLALEGHANVIVSTTDAFLRAFDRISNFCFGTNLDMCWQFMQREYLPWTIYKLGSRIFHVHVRDGDGMMCYLLPPGQGIIDWNGVIRALKEVGYNGYLSFEMGGYSRPDKYLAGGLTYLKEVLKEECVYEK